jgi:hypothetical protein
MNNIIAQDVCDGCKHCCYEKENNVWYCDLDLEPTLNPDDPESIYCSKRKVD